MSRKSNNTKSRSRSQIKRSNKRTNRSSLSSLNTKINLDKSKTRIFIIGAHSNSCEYSEIVSHFKIFKSHYATKGIEKVDNIKSRIDLSQYPNLKIISTQNIGRYALTNFREDFFYLLKNNEELYNKLIDLDSVKKSREYDTDIKTYFDEIYTDKGWDRYKKNYLDELYTKINVYPKTDTEFSQAPPNYDYSFSPLYSADDYSNYTGVFELTRFNIDERKYKLNETPIFFQSGGDRTIEQNFIRRNNLPKGTDTTELQDRIRIKSMSKEEQLQLALRIPTDITLIPSIEALEYSLSIKGLTLDDYHIMYQLNYNIYNEIYSKYRSDFKRQFQRYNNISDVTISLNSIIMNIMDYVLRTRVFPDEKIIIIDNGCKHISNCKYNANSKSKRCVQNFRNNNVVLNTKGTKLTFNEYVNKVRRQSGNKTK